MKLQFQIQKWLIGTDLTGHYMNDLFTTSCSIIELFNKGENNNNGNELAELMKIIPLEKRKSFLLELKKDGISYNMQSLYYKNIEYSININYYEKENVNKIFSTGVITTYDKQAIFEQIADKYKLKISKGRRFRSEKDEDYNYIPKRESKIKNIKIKLTKDIQLKIIIFSIDYINRDKNIIVSIEGTGLPWGMRNNEFHHND